MSDVNPKTVGRRFAFQFLYHLQLPEFKGFNKDDILEKVEDFENSYDEPDSESLSIPLTEKSKSFATELIYGVMNKNSELKDIVSPLLQKWTIDRLDKIDLTILLLGSFELTEMKDTPKNVVINEAVELGKLFGSKETPSFINAVLDKIGA